MKKILLLPKTDTVILCLPEQWVGALIVCKLTPICDNISNSDEMESEVEKMIKFCNKRRKQKSI